MSRRLLLVVLLVAAVVPVASASSTTGVKTFAVPTGGFAIGLPGNWVDLSKAAPGVLAQLEKVPSFKAFAQAASQNPALKLIAADPAGKGTVYMNVGAARIGTLTLTQLTAATAADLKKTLGAKGIVTTMELKIGSVPAYRIHLAKKGSPNETDEYLLVRDQVEYVIVYVAPAASWKKQEPTFTASARSFRLVPGPNLSKVILSPKQVGAGYKLGSFPFGSSFIDEPTLDLCAGVYPSEALRIGRLQVRYSQKGGGVEVSNEVVRYTTGGAQQALGEVSSVATACAKKPAVVKGTNAVEIYHVSPLKDSKLPSGAIAVRLEITVTQGKKQQTQTGVAIYQVKGDTLSGVYAFVGKGTTFADTERIAFHAAEQSAKNLGAGSTGFTA